MSRSVKQQIVISGVGGQGVLFITRLLAEAAILKKFHVITSETHGMAQRGGTVLSHLKVGEFSSPLIRPFQADGLLALKSANLSQHGFYLRPEAWAIANCSKKDRQATNYNTFTMDADQQAKIIKNPKSVNLILLGFTLSVIPESGENRLFCSIKEIRTVLENRFKGKTKMLNDAVNAMETGYYHKN